MMKYLPVALLMLLFACAGSDDEQKEMSVQDVDLSDFRMYVGSSAGAVEYKYYEDVPEDKVDSLRSVIINRRMTEYKRSLYTNSKIEFNGSKISYTYLDTVSNSVRRVVADYRFEVDSLFALRSDGSKLFVALGSQPNALYMRKGIARYRSAGQYVQKTDDVIYDLQSVLDLYGSQLTNENDTIIWLNAKYLFN